MNKKRAEKRIIPFLFCIILGIVFLASSIFATTTVSNSVINTTGNIIGAGLYKGYTIYSDNNYIYGIDDKGNIVAGGPNSVNVTDPTDFGQVYASIVDFAFTPVDYDTGATIYLAPVMGNHLQYIVKTPVVLTHCHNLVGPGRNKGNIFSANSTTMAGQVLFTLRPSPSECYIQQIENVKFGMQVGYENQSSKTWYPSAYYNISNEAELIVINDEFRDTQNYSIYYNGNNAFSFSNYNYIVDSWFLTGAGLYLTNVGDLQMTGNKFTSGTNNTIINSNKVFEFGNVILGGTYASPGVMNFTNDSFENEILRGLVGINTSSPQNALNVVNGTINISAVNPSFYLNNATGSYWTIWTDNSGYFRIDSASGSTAFTIKRPGNGIGINTTTPQNPLNIMGTVNISAASPTLYLDNGSSYWTFWTDSSGSLRFDSAAGSTALTMSRTNNNIGIGTSSPTQKLDVNGNINVSNGNITISQMLNLFQSSALPTCSSAAGTNGSIMRNTTGLVYCNNAGTWTYIFAG
ncbi:MAG TPA: hypothetical protein VMC07_00860 [Candidatus Omnitrophota bacterium]|nr:hypothetical protein [Candidatus Omnitrophota bacterium]